MRLCSLLICGRPSVHLDVRPHVNPFRIQLERLRRHTEQATSTYDQISLLDLSHALRIWADLKAQTHLAPRLATTLSFKSAVPSKRLCRAIRDRTYVLFSTPSTVHTSASRNELGFSGGQIKAGGEAIVGASAKFNADGSLDIGSYYYVEGQLDSSLKLLLGEGQTTRGDFIQWLGSEVLRMRYASPSGGHVSVGISRETFIRRMANTFDASHPRVLSPSGTVTNSLDPALNFLMGLTVAGLPVPYFVLLKTAQDIVSTAHDLVALE